jgi:predicted nuclease with TOPRIM domain
MMETKELMSDRRLGWCPPPQIQVSIAVETYEYIKQLAADKNQRSCPVYDTLQSIMREFKQLKEDLEETKEFLALAIDDKKFLKEENKQMREELQKYNQLIN